MRRRVSAVMFALGILATGLASPARALVIITTPLRVGSFDQIFGQRVLGAPNNGFGGGTLDQVMAAAATYWESMIADNYTVRITYGWENRLGTSVLAATAGSSTANNHLSDIAFAADAFAWFVDPTPPSFGDPSGNSEFQTFETSQQDLGGGPIDIELVYTATNGDAAGRFDLFSVALHEIGHALGLSQITGLVDIGVPHEKGLVIQDPLPDAGSVIPLFSDDFFSDISFSHLALPDSVMFPFRDDSTRTLLTDADVLVLAQVAHLTDVTLNPATELPEPAGTGAFIFTAFVARRLQRRRDKAARAGPA